MSTPHQHGDAAEELRLLALALLDRMQPAVQGMLAAVREGAVEQPSGQRGDQPLACGWCPLCSAIALLRGDRPELGARIAEHAEGLLTAVREVLEEPVAQPPPTATRHARVQRIVVREPSADGGC